MLNHVLFFTIVLLKNKGALKEEELTVLKDKTLAINADILVRKAKSNPIKSL